MGIPGYQGIVVPHGDHCIMCGKGKLSLAPPSLQNLHGGLCADFSIVADPGGLNSGWLYRKPVNSIHRQVSRVYEFASPQTANLQLSVGIGSCNDALMRGECLERQG